MKQIIYAGFALIALTNLVLYGGVAYNRSADTPQQLTLSERELSMPYSYYNDENSGLALQLNWQLVQQQDKYEQYANRQQVVDIQKIQDLGFDPEQVKHNNSYWAGTQTREVFWLLEFNGDSYRHYIEWQEERYQRQLADAQAGDNNKETIERLENAYQFAKQKASRLFVVDTGVDPEQLRKDYPGEQFLLVKGLIKARWQPSQVNVPEGFVLVMQKLSVGQIMVPGNYAGSLAGLRPKNYFGSLKDDDEQIKFNARLAWGKRYEPWIVDISPL